LVRTPFARLRQADAADADRLTSFINEAYAPAEGFLYDGPRITVEEVLEKLAHGRFLLDLDAEGTLRGCVFVGVTGESGYFGLLAVSPREQKRGLGRSLALAAESLCRSEGCRTLTIDVVNHRRPLFAFYESLGFEVVGQRPFEDERLNRPAHFVIMRKDLHPARRAPRP
jgi:GNAT superfamily N-acetyltransferase